MAARFALHALCAAMVAESAAAQDVVTDPSWLQLPAAYQMAAVYPPLALFLELRGRAVIECGTSELGRLESCRVVEDGPQGVGFGTAALKLAPLFQMSPKRVNGRPVAGGTVRVPISFELPPSNKPPSTPLMPSRGPSSEALALARRVVAATVDFDRIIAEHQRFIQRKTFDGADPAAVETAKAASTSAFRDSVPEAREIYAAAIADTYTVDELRALAEFFEGPVGRAWTRGAASLERRRALDMVRLDGQLKEEARVRFCAQRACVPPKPAAAGRP